MYKLDGGLEQVAARHPHIKQDVLLVQPELLDHIAQQQQIDSRNTLKQAPGFIVA